MANKAGLLLFLGFPQHSCNFWLFKEKLKIRDAAPLKIEMYRRARYKANQHLELLNY